LARTLLTRRNHAAHLTRTAGHGDANVAMTCNVKRPVLLPTSNLGKFTAHREPDAIRVPGAVAGILFAKLGNRRVLWHKAASKIKGFRPRCLPRHDKDLGHNVRVTAVASTHSTLNVGGDRSEVTLVEEPELAFVLSL